MMHRRCERCVFFWTRWLGGNPKWPGGSLRLCSCSAGWLRCSSGTPGEQDAVATPINGQRYGPFVFRRLSWALLEAGTAQRQSWLTHYGDMSILSDTYH